eukprot:CAMPEP_0178868750 /NCGR_PEP_ID=MMETSP0747-20121128/6159_1 /TAXON_ID=913974 /ORGANISM="Nitzschia punctata, Strain CCMP561" /LENGTH=89 /DNA_ID=CAMNT_0020535723 /DNA_START=30 /DNA_END=295 /DNA_ORIENTATION=+
MSQAVATMLVLFVACTSPQLVASKFYPKIDMDNSSSELFEIAHEIEVSSPSHFPKPTWLLNDPDVVVIAEPAIGKHRPEKDVVMAYAEG